MIPPPMSPVTTPLPSTSHGSASSALPAQKHAIAQGTEMNVLPSIVAACRRVPNAAAFAPPTWGASCAARTTSPAARPPGKRTMMAYAIMPERAHTETGTECARSPISARRLITSIDMNAASSAMIAGTKTPAPTSVAHTCAGPASLTT